MHRFNMATLAAIGVVASLASFTPAQAQMQDCTVNGNKTGFGQAMTGYFTVASGTSCNAGISMDGVIESSKIVQKPKHGTLTQVNVSTFQYAAKAGYAGADAFAVQVKGKGPTTSGTSQVNLKVTVK